MRDADKVARRLIRLRLILLGMVLIGSTLILYGTGLFRLFMCKRQLLTFISNFGPYGFAVIVFLQVPQVIIALIPGDFTGLLAGYLYRPLWGSLLSTTGLILGSYMAIILVRNLGKPFVDKFVPTSVHEQFDYLFNRKGNYLNILLIPHSWISQRLSLLYTGSRKYFDGGLCGDRRTWETLRHNPSLVWRRFHQAGTVREAHGSHWHRSNGRMDCNGQSGEVRQSIQGMAPRNRSERLANLGGSEFSPATSSSSSQKRSFYRLRIDSREVSLVLPYITRPICLRAAASVVRIS